MQTELGSADRQGVYQVWACSLGPPPPGSHAASAPVRERSRAGGNSCGQCGGHGCPDYREEEKTTVQHNEVSHHFK